MCCSSILCAGHHPLQQEIGVIRGTLHLHGMWYGEKGNFPLFVSPSCILLGDQAVFGPWGTVCSISMAVSRRFFSGVHPNIRANFPVPRVATALPSVPTPFSGRPNGVTLSSLPPCFWAVGPFRPSLVRGLRPRNAPPPTTCLADLVSLFVTGAQSKEFRQTTSPQSYVFPVGAGLVPTLCPNQRTNWQGQA